MRRRRGTRKNLTMEQVVEGMQDLMITPMTLRNRRTGGKSPIFVLLFFNVSLTETTEKYIILRLITEELTKFSSVQRKPRVMLGAVNIRKISF